MPRLNLHRAPIPGRPYLLDLYCGAGGASEGYWRAGFNVVGVDIAPQPHYPFPFLQMDALEALGRFYTERLLFKCHDGRVLALRRDAVVAMHASPPCQAYSHTQRIQGRTYPALIAGTRWMMQFTGLPFVIENVEDARFQLESPITLCGAMFPELTVYRHRLFECSFPIIQPPHPAHAAPQNKMGRPPADGEFMHVVGNFSGVPQARQAMDIPWMTRNELKEAIPPAFSHYVGMYLRAAVMGSVSRSAPLLASSEASQVSQDA